MYTPIPNPPDVPPYEEVQHMRGAAMAARAEQVFGQNPHFALAVLDCASLALEAPPRKVLRLVMAILREVGLPFHAIRLQHPPPNFKGAPDGRTRTHPGRPTRTRTARRTAR